MKRTHDSIDTSQARSQAPARRQEPVSCQFCRVKKLKCSRESPCSNCLARNIECVGVQATSRGTAATNVLPNAHGLPADQLSLQSLHTRLQRVEAALSLRDTLDSTISSTITFTEPPQPLSSHTTPQAYESNNGVRKESTGVDVDSIEMTKRMVQSESRLHRGFDPAQLLQLGPNPESSCTTSEWYEVLPAYERAIQLVDFYAHNVCWTYHFMHLPTLHRQLQQTYAQLSRNQTPEPSILALLCAVFAVAKYFSKPATSLSSDEAFAVIEERSYCEFVSLASRALAEAQHLDHPTVESIQAVLLLTSCLLLNLGHMTAYRSLITLMFMSAQALLIHQVDSPTNRRLRQNTEYNRVELEIKRRIWWHIVSTDWIFAFMSGTQTESYIPHTPRIHVQLPSNTDDASIIPSYCPNEPHSVPTEMTYFLLRCRVAIIFREFMDVASAQGLALDEVDYDTILAFDRKINAFVDEVPYFLKMTPESRRRCVQLDQQRPYLVWQRLMAQFGPATGMSGFHRAYMARGAKDPKYAYSREVCLRSARTIMEIEKVVRTEMPPSLTMPDPNKIWALIYQIFFATMVLVMDYHLNKNEPSAGERIDEIMECCQRLEAAKGVSNVAARGLEELQAVMRRWGLLKDVGARSATVSSPAHLRTTQQENPEMVEDESIASSWIDMWDFDVELDAPQWNALFQDLESHSNIF